MEIPFSQACANNQDPILKILSQLDLRGDVLEMGHGTGQHALHFSRHLSVNWFSSDRAENLWMLEKRNELPDNLTHSIELEIGKSSMLSQVGRSFDSLFTANTLHIMSEKLALKFCAEVHEIIKPYGDLIIYGPFKFEGKFTSESNKQFDLHLKSQDPKMGIRDFEIIRDNLVEFTHQNTYEMPANNFILHFKKSS